MTKQLCRTMDTSMKEVLQNVAVIKVSQDPLGIQGKINLVQDSYT